MGDQRGDTGAKDVDSQSGRGAAAIRRWTWVIIGVAWVWLFLQRAITPGVEKIAYSDFKSALARGKVIEVVVTPTAVRGTLTPDALPGKVPRAPSPALDKGGASKPAPKPRV